MQQLFIRYCHLRISVEDLMKFFIFTVREVSRNVGFLWSVFFRVWAESDTRKYRSEKACILGYFTQCVKYSNPRILGYLSIFAFLHEEKTCKIVKAIYTFILHIKKQKCCGNEIVWLPAVIHEEKARFKWTF